MCHPVSEHLFQESVNLPLLINLNMKSNAYLHSLFPVHVSKIYKLCFCTGGAPSGDNWETSAAPESCGSKVAGHKIFHLHTRDHSSLHSDVLIHFTSPWIQTVENWSSGFSEASHAEPQPIKSWRSTLTWRTGVALGTATLEKGRGSCRAPAWTPCSTLRRTGGGVVGCRLWERSSLWWMRRWGRVCSTSPQLSIWLEE